ncbi:DUF402 domain-containing protein [Arthrobacter sp. efr-133-R2A-120]|uniref:DUF402 domain-containing protein n=1 Tax=Arthrobacter sp. efr-133-R2A-120 TaxID=3040277 RepID=UPI002551864B|nr:DUF402 domain-containing protein [Arthrobacter sp. efr-133-R2A-120]
MSGDSSRLPGGLQPGDLVVARNRKWDGTAHWVVPGSYLGEDIHGWWIFQGQGEFCSRPGAAFYTASDAVLLVPRSGEYVATFYDDSYPGDFRIYVDLATAHEWKTIEPGVSEFHVIDMDLDVIRSVHRDVFIDDEDEFDEHSASMAYPDGVVESIRHECDELFRAISKKQAPFDGTGPISTCAEWFRKGRA